MSKQCGGRGAAYTEGRAAHHPLSCRIVAAILLCVAAYCAFGFAATYEPTNRNISLWRIGDGLAVAAALMRRSSVVWRSGPARPARRGGMPRWDLLDLKFQRELGVGRGCRNGQFCGFFSYGNLQRSILPSDSSERSRIEFVSKSRRGYEHH